MPTKKIAKNANLLPIVLTFLLVVAAFAMGSMWTELKLLKQGTTGLPTAQQPAAAPEENQPLSDDLWKEVVANAVYSEGEESAQVTLVEFTDYQCPFCKRHFDETAAQIESQYIKTGKVRWMLHDLPLSFHQNAHEAAEAARCAGDQGKYRAMHDQLFSTQTAWAEIANAAATFSTYAKTLGLNVVVFDSCLSEGKYTQAVDDDLTLAAKVGANGTPTFYINGQPLVGAQPFASFKAAIDAAL